MINVGQIREMSRICFTASPVIAKSFPYRWKLPRTWVARHYLIYILEGSGEAAVDGQQLFLSPGKLYVLHPGQIVEARFNPLSPARVYVVRFSAILPDGPAANRSLLKDTPLGGRIELPSGDSPQLVMLLEQMYGLRPRSPLNSWKRNILFQELLHTLVSGLDAGEEREGVRPESADRVVERILRYMNEHYMEELSMRQLARMHGISPTNFSGWFKSHTGVSPVQYVNGRRIEEAKKLMGSRQRLSDIAKRVGYKDELYFSRSFKKAVGVSPTLYMRSRLAEHIATLDPILNDYLAALDVEPVATVYQEGMGLVDGVLPYIADRLAHTRRISQSDLQELGAVSPDLILGKRPLQPTALESMNQIAPTVLLSIHHDWKRLLFDVASLLDRTEVFQRWIRQFERRTAEARRRLFELIGRDRTVMILVAAAGHYRLYGGKRQLGELLYKELGLTPPRDVQLAGHYRRVSLEEVAALDPDYLFLTTLTADSCQHQKRLLADSALWHSLRCVRNGHVFEVESWFNHHAPFKQSIVIDRVLDLFAGVRS